MKFAILGFCVVAVAAKPHINLFNGQAQVIPAAIYGEPSDSVQPKQVYNGPPAPLDPDGRVIDTDEVAKLKAEHLAILAKAHAEAAAIEAMKITNEEPTPETETTSSSSSSGGYSYEAPDQKAQVIPATTYGAAIQESQANLATPSSEPSVPAQPEQAYNGPQAPLDQDGRVIDTDEVAKLKAEHLATLAKAHAEAAAIEAMIVASGYSYDEPTPVTDTTSSSSSFGSYSYEAPIQKVQVIPATIYDAAVPEQPQQAYNGPPAPLGPDGRVVDTEEVAKLKAELLATLAKANAEAAAIEAMESALGYTYETPVTETASSSASFGGYSYQAPVEKILVIPATIYGAAVPAQKQQAYSVVPAPLGQDGRVIDTDEVAKLKAEHLAILAKAYSEVAAIEAMKAALA